ncbi:cupin domain-containing protein [Nocardia camponoti]|nr:cupin domain-containing protein [Nocardia camponoti]
MAETGSVLNFRSGNRITLVDQGADGDGEYLRIEHVIPQTGRLVGPHWHPILQETFHVRAGQLRFRVDGVETTAGPGTTVVVKPRATHEFWNDSSETVLEHEVRPPLHHWEMFEFMSRLDQAGRMTKLGLPRNPLALGLLWEYGDGYVAGPPPALQRAVFGNIAKLARTLGYERKLVASTSADQG